MKKNNISILQLIAVCFACVLILFIYSCKSTEKAKRGPLFDRSAPVDQRKMHSATSGVACASPRSRVASRPFRVRANCQVGISYLTMTRYLGKIHFEVAELVQPLLVSGMSDYSR